MHASPDLPNVTWRKSSKSTATGNECVELAAFAHAIAIRDSKDPNGPRLTLPPVAFQRLTDEIRRGGYDI
ncbi:DUF397 domain-containing protein [Thermomonospora cellulosilytica]|uniref:DUF397 domain-containing protein n=1 Tax=Thermomonospora cellulosilytica TaxID=1411118 RepID=A0A7W3MTF4_9ACTN|nr:DUF397 domain-containing protein [Thermomonospora cellulosilytica]MBA9001570.1 hypothetical protein [Thermomonospora cellulosilytica]